MAIVSKRWTLQLLFLSADMALVFDLWYGSTFTECYRWALAKREMSISLKCSDCYQTLTLPKPLVEFANKPMIEHQVENLAAAGVTDIVLAVNYRPEVMAAALKKVNKTRVSELCVCGSAKLVSVREIIQCQYRILH